MNSSFYEMSSFVLGLRSEYQRMESKLQELSKDARLDSRYANLHFSLNNRNINYDYTRKNKSPNRMVSSTLFGSYVEKKNGVYCSDEVLTIIDSKKFGKIAKNILDDSFSDGIELSTIFRNRDNSNQVVKMNIHSGSIHIYLDNLSKLKSSITMSYYATEDMISVNKKMGVLTKSDIYDLLNVKFKGEVLSDYHIDLIDYADNNKPIELMMDKGFRTNCDLDIIEERNRFILQKKTRNL